MVRKKSGPEDGPEVKRQQWQMVIDHQMGKTQESEDEYEHKWTG